MFKNIASDVFGLSDIGKIIEQKDYDMTDVDDYVFEEDQEKIYVVIKSKTDEYCFTNLAFIHLNGNLAISKKRMLNRYLYKHYPISHVRLETAGTVDLDVEIKFKSGEQEISIDIDKKQIDQAKAIYKALFSIGEKCKDIQKYMATLDNTFEAINHMFLLRELPEQVILNLPDLLNQTTQQVEAHYNARRQEIQNYNFGATFERYLKA